MSKVTKLSESDLKRIVNRVINENMYDNDLYSGVMNVLRNSIATKEEKIDVLKTIIDEMESYKKIRRRFDDKLSSGGKKI